MSTSGKYCLWYPPNWYHIYSGGPDPQPQFESDEGFANQNSQRLDTGVVLDVEVGGQSGDRCTGVYVNSARTVYRTDQISFAGSPSTRYVLQASGSSTLFMSVVDVMKESTCYHVEFMSYSLDILNTTLATDDQIVSTFSYLS